MHESSLIKNMLQEVERVVRDSGGCAIGKISVELSEFGGLDEEHFRFHFDQETKGTAWQDVCLEVKKIPRGPEARLVSVTLKEE